MANAVSDYAAMPLRSWDVEHRTAVAIVPIGGTGAVNSAGTDYRVPPGVTIARASGGTYTLTYPAAFNGAIIPFVALTASMAVFGGAGITARSITAGTATIVTIGADDGATGDPASGDALGILFVMQPVQAY